MTLRGSGGYLYGHKKILSINIDTRWGDFIHEFQHFEFDQLINGNIPKLKAIVEEGGNIEDALPMPTIIRLGKRKVKLLQRLLEKSLPTLAINESLSVSDELALLGFRKYIPSFFGGKISSASEIKDYALRHQINELRELLKEGNELTKVQKKSLQIALFKRFGLKFAVGGDALIILTAPTLIVLFLANQIYYDGHVWIYKDEKNGKWYIVRPEK